LALYQYAEHGQIESEKLGTWLEYRRSRLTAFQARTSFSSGRGKIATVLSSGN
jgi:hypothetical protein